MRSHYHTHWLYQAALAAGGTVVFVITIHETKVAQTTYTRHRCASKEVSHVRAVESAECCAFEVSTVYDERLTTGEEVPYEEVAIDRV